MNIFKGLSLFALSLILISSSALAQVSITTLGPGGIYTQDFSALTPANFALTDNTSITGVYAFRQIGNATPNIFEADNGSGLINGFKNYGAAGTPERALGSFASGLSTGDLYYGIRFQNDSGVTITSIEVNYVGEQWRDGSTAAQTLEFSYRQSAADITDLTTGTYTGIPALNFITPTNTGSGQLDGNAPANRISIIAGFAVTVPPGEEIMIRWTDFAEAIANHGVAIDDLQVTARAGTTAADATISGRVATLSGRGIAGARLVLSGGDLAQPLYTITNAFGYFSFTGIESGRTYAVTVNSKSYQFANPTQTVDLSDSAFDVNFVAEP